MLGSVDVKMRERVDALMRRCGAVVTDVAL